MATWPKITRTPAGVSIENLSPNDYILIRAALDFARPYHKEIEKAVAFRDVDLRLRYLHEDLYTSGVICECTDTFICAMHGGPEVID